MLTLPHGAAHERMASTLRKAILQIDPSAIVEVVNALDHCARWFRAFYNSYEIPLRYWPGLWGWIESIQHKGSSTAPGWVYRQGAQPLFRLIRAFDPDVGVATEVGLCELAAMFKRETEARFCLVAVPTGVDIDRAWAQDAVDLYVVAPGEAEAQSRVAGVPRAKVLPCGFPIDPAFASLPDRAAARRSLQMSCDVPLVVVEFGGTGLGKPRHIWMELRKLQQPVQACFISGKNRRLKHQLQLLCAGDRRYRVLGWVDNMHEWLAAADLLVGKPGGSIMWEAVSSGTPFLALDPLPGEERRNCDWIEERGVGYWVRSPQDLAPYISSLLADREKLRSLSQRTLPLARPRAAYVAAEAILTLPYSCTQEG